MALSFNSPTPCRLRRPDHPNLFLLGLAPKLIPSFYLFLQQALPAGQGRADGQGRGAEGGPGGARGPAGGRGVWDGGWLLEETCSRTGPDVGATAPMAVERRAGVLGLRAAHP